MEYQNSGPSGTLRLCADQFESSTSPPLPSGHTSDIWPHVFSFARRVGNLMQRSCVYHSVSCTIILSVVYYPVSCALLGHFCNLSVSCMLQLEVVHFSASSVSFSGLHGNAVCSYVLLGHLCTSPSVVHYSVSCVLLCQLCITRSVVYYPGSCLRLGQLRYTQSVG